MNERSVLLAILSLWPPSLPQKERLRRGFALAWFIHQDRAAADEIVSRALAEHEPFVANQVRYQDYSAPKQRTKVQLTPDLYYQYLVLKHSADRQLRELTAGLVTQDDTMVVYFFAFIAFTLFRTRSSFRATAAVGRLLLRLSAEETRQLYFVLDQDARERGDDEFNRQKKHLYDCLKERFGASLIPEQVHLEKTFRQQPRSQSLEALAEACLEQFSLWRDKCVLAAADRPTKDISLSLDSDPAGAERDRMHVALHCLRSLAKLVLGVDRPVLIPQFACASSSGNGPSSLSGRLQPPPIHDADYQRLRTPAVLQRQRRRTTVEPVLQCKVDGEARSVIDLRHSTRSEAVAFADTDAYLQIWAGDVLLATYELPAIEDLPGDGPLRQSITLEGGQCLTFFCCRRDPAWEEPVATVLIDHRETHFARRLYRWFDRRRSALRPWVRPRQWRWTTSVGLASASMVLLITGVWLWSSMPRTGSEDSSITALWRGPSPPPLPPAPPREATAQRVLRTSTILDPGDDVSASLTIHDPRSLVQDSGVSAFLIASANELLFSHQLSGELENLSSVFNQENP